MVEVVIQPVFAVRKFPDPFNKISDYRIEHYIFICKASYLPHGIPLDPNPREQKTSKAIYKDVKESLLSASDLTFHLKNKGITVLAQSVDLDERKGMARITFREGDGIVDGGHTYAIIKESKGEIPDNQYVKLEVLTGVPKELIEPIAQGLNTSVQVSQMSLDNLEGKFEWIKEEIKGENYETLIAYKDNAEGFFSARDIVALLTLFNVELFPESESYHPKIAYTSKAECLRRFEEHEASYKKLQPILRDILELYDYVQLQAKEPYNSKYKGKFEGLAFVQKRERGKYPYIFLGKEAEYRIADGALYPILGAFRFLVEDKGKHFGWKLRSFNEVKKFFDGIGAELIMSTKGTSDSRDKNPNSIGKDDTHWQNLYKTVALEYFQGWSQKPK
jgi:hypothetical protein